MSTGTTTGTTTATPTGTGTPRKLRGDAKLAQLTPEQRELLRVWLEDDNETYATVVRMVHHQFGLHVSKSAVGAYYQRHLLPARYDDETDTAAFLATLPVGAFDAATIKHAKALAFSALTRPLPHLDTAARLLDLVHRVEKQEIARERLALEQRRVALREAEHATRPPRQPRPAASEKPAKPARSPRPTPPPIDAAPPQPTPTLEPSASPAAPAPVAPELSPSASPCSLLATHSSLLSGKTPPDSPRFPAYSKLAQPSTPPPTNAQLPSPVSPPPVLGSSPVKPASEPPPSPPARSATPAWLRELAARL